MAARARLRADVRVVSEDYLDVMRIPVVRGRSFNESDRAGQPRAVLVNETMARTSAVDEQTPPLARLAPVEGA
jgi:hypothetical protein